MKIGLIGAENSHAKHFLTVYNDKKKYSDISITHIYGGDDPDLCAKLCEQYNLENCSSEDDVIEKCDAVVVTYRKGSLHYEPVMNALRKGKAVFNDKPFATSVEQADEIVRYAKEHKLLLTGGSNVKSLAGLAPLDEKIKPGATIVISYTADADSQYDGYWFYGIHIVETCLRLCGKNYRTVSAFRNKDTVVSTIGFDDKQCVLINNPSMTDLKITILSESCAESFLIPMDYQSIGPDEFAEMLITGKAPRDYEYYSKASALLSEIITSAKL